MRELTAADWASWLAAWQWPEGRIEQAPVPTALGRVLASPAHAVRAVPPAAAAAAGGLAVAAAATGPGVYLQLGDGAWPVAAGELLPAGTDAVLAEDDYLQSGQLVWVVDRLAPGAGVLAAGSEVAVGEALLPAGARLTGPALAALLAAGLTRAPVVRRPRVAVFPLGAEWTEPAGALAPGQAPETGSLMLAAALQEWGAEPQVHPITASSGQLTERLALAARTADMLAVIDSQRQSGAAWLEVGGKPCLHLPGRPDALWVGALRWLRGLVGHWHGDAEAGRGAPARVMVAEALTADLGGRLLLAAEVAGRLVAWPLPGRLGRQRSAVAANALVADDAEAAPGDEVAVELLEPLAALRQRVLLAAPAAATGVAQRLLPAGRVHVLGMPSSAAAAAMAAGLVHGRLEGGPGAWRLVRVDETIVNQAGAADIDGQRQ